MNNNDIEKAIEVLKVVRYCWADQITDDDKIVSDYDAITQAIGCLEEYNEHCKIK